MGQAIKGETLAYFRGVLERACNTPEQNMSRQERAAHTAACKAAKKAKQPKPLPPDPYADIRDDARKLVEFAEDQELRGLVELRKITMGKGDFLYEMTCLVQRNGLKAVRDRLTRAPKRA